MDPGNYPSLLFDIIAYRGGRKEHDTCCVLREVLNNSGCGVGGLEPPKKEDSVRSFCSVIQGFGKTEIAPDDLDFRRQGSRLRVPNQGADMDTLAK